MWRISVLLFGACFLFACAHASNLVPDQREVLGRSLYLVDEDDTHDVLALVHDWQGRERESRQREDVASMPQPYLLRDEYNSFSRPARRALANEIVAWVQDLSKKYYRNDPTEEDYWPTTNEFLSGTGDDCDGLELLLYIFLLDHGFKKETVYRAVIRRGFESHMVTLWFEDTDDPWVLDPTGQAAPKKAHRLSSLSGWVVRVMFNREESYAPSKPVY